MTQTEDKIQAQVASTAGVQKAIFVGGPLGGLVMFVWMMVSWMALPWHRQTFHGFIQQEEIAQTLAVQATQAGVYLLPAPGQMEAAVGGLPYMFAVILPPGVSHPQVFQCMAVELATCIVGGSLLGYFCWVASQAGLKYWERVKFLVWVGVLVAIAAFVPYWNWFQFPSDFVLLGMGDCVVGTALAALVISKMTPKSP